MPSQLFTMARSFKAV
ncbi:TPA: hypothetical protein ACIVS6_002559, partial [Salmonella enterica subsp. enterica serovar Waycross]